MASIITNKKNGSRTIAVFVGDGERKFIRLGRVNMKQAESVKGFVEDLVACKITGTAPRNATAEWVAAAPDLVRQRLERTGLIKSQERAGVRTLGAWLDKYIAGRKDVKLRTHINYDQARKALLAFFGKDKPLGEITHGECEDFRVWMRTEKKLSEGTTRRQTKRCKQFFAAAVKRNIIAENPFEGIKCSNFAEDRFYFVSRAEATAVLEACPDAEWRAIFSLARFGGLRVPSELLSLEWSDVNWDKQRFTVRSPKTEHHDGKSSRVVPIFAELHQYLRDAFEQAEPGQRYVISRYRDGNANLRTQLTRIIERAGLKLWQKLFQNLRSTRETELAEAFPIQVVTGWLGNSPEIARKHYLQITDEHFERAATSGAGGGDSLARTSERRNAPTSRRRNARTAPAEAHQNAHQQAHQNPHLHTAAPRHTVSQGGRAERHNSRTNVALCDEVRNGAGRCDCAGPPLDTPKGTRTPVFRMRT